MSVFPSKFIRAQTCNIISKTFTDITEYGMNSEVSKRGNPHKFQLDFTTTPFNESLARELDAYMDSLDGRYTEFTIKCPLLYRGSATAFNVAATHAAGEKEITISGLTTAGIGDYINFSNHQKAYKIVSLVGTVLTIRPRLFESISNANTASEAVFTCRMMKDNLSLSLDAKKGLVPVQVSAIEV